jgi:phthiocerol/phenolphthiocerol synthesis type-I polyketide synthase A
VTEQFILSLTHPVLRDHTVYGQHILPGLAYVDFLYQCFRSRGHEPLALELRNLRIFHPLVVNRDRPLRCEVDISAGHADSWKIAVRAAPMHGNRNGDERIRYVTAEMHPARPVFTETLDVVAIRSAAKAAQLSQVYAGCRDRELVHGGFMRAEGAVYATDDAIYADVAVGAEAARDADHVLFQPALLDGAAVGMQAGLGASATTHETALALPLSCGSFRASALLQRDCVVRVRRESLRQRGDVSFLGMDFFSTAGAKVAELTDLACKVVRDPSSIDERRAWSSSGLAPAPVAGRTVRAARGEWEAFLQRLVGARLHRPARDIDPSSPYYELGLKSADMLELVVEIEGELDMALPPTLLFEYTTIDELAAHLAERSEPIARSPRVAVRAVQDVVGRRDPVEPRGDPADVAIIGIAIRCPNARTVEEYWDNLATGRDCITEIPPTRWDVGRHYHADKRRLETSYSKWGGFIDGVDEFDPLLFRISPNDAALIDPQQRLFLQSVWTVFEATGYTRRRLRDVYQSRVGVYVGAMYQHYSMIPTDVVRQSATALSSYSAIANRVSQFFGLSGPSISVDTMCSSSTVAIHLACRDLLSDDCRLAVAGGVNISIHPRKYVGLAQAQLLASSPFRGPFADGDGFVPGEAVGVVLLKPLARAIADGDTVLAVIKATATNHCGQGNGVAVPHVDAERELIEETLRRAGVDARTVTYVEAAATGAAAADAVEMAALQRAFAPATSDVGFCAIGSVKSSIGHAEAASGTTQIIKVVLQLQHGLLAPAIKTEPANPAIAFDGTPFYVERNLTPWMRPVVATDGQEQQWPRRALINSFGAGGSNASVLIEEYAGPPVPAAPAESEDQTELVLFSAADGERLQMLVQQMMCFLRSRQELRLRDIAYTLQCGREPLPARVAFIASDRRQLLDSMNAYLAGSEPAAESDMTPTMYRGDVVHDRTELRTLGSGAVGEAVVQLLLGSRDLPKLALLWTRGVEVAWEALPREDARIVTLPTYPFKRQRYWLPPADDTRATSAPEAVETKELRDALSRASRAAPMSSSDNRAERPQVELPRTDLECAIAAVWEDVLGVRGIGVVDRFLDLGGTSLTGGQVIVRLRDLYGVDVPVRALIAHDATIATVAVEIVSALAELHQDEIAEHLSAIAET